MKISDFLRNCLVLISGTTLAQGLIVIASPLLTRLYSPKEFGLLATYISILAILALIGTLQYENAIPLPEDKFSGLNLIVLSLVILVVMSLISTLLLWLTKDRIALLLNVPQLAQYFWLIPFSLLGMGLFNILYRWYMRSKSFQAIARTKFTQTCGMLVVQICGGMLGMGSLFLLIGDVFGRMGGCLRLTYQFLREEGKGLGQVTLKSLGSVGKRYIKFPLLGGWSALFKELSDQLPGISLAIFYGPEVVGWFMLVQRTLGLPLNLIGYSVGNVYMAEVINLIKEKSKENFIKLYWKMVRNLLIFSLPIMISLALGAQWIYIHIFGAAWGMAGVYLQILLPLYLLQFLAIPLAPTLYVLERQDLQLIREVIRLLLLIIVLIFILKMALPPLEAVSLISAMGFLGFLVNVFISWLAIKHFCKQDNPMTAN